MVILTTIADATVEHIILAYSALFVSIAIAIPLAFASLYSNRLASIVIKFANLAQARTSFRANF
jgi:osmoprotectant transport system permease protein